MYVKYCTHVEFPQSLHYLIYEESHKSGNNMMEISCLGSKYRKGTSIRQAPDFRHLRALRKSPWKFIIWMNEL